jgi:hypothetical protein
MNLVFYDRVSIQLIEAEGGKRNWRFRTNSAPYQSGSLGRTRFCILARTSKTGRCGRTTVDEFDSGFPQGWRKTKLARSNSTRTNYPPEQSLVG